MSFVEKKKNYFSFTATQIPDIEGRTYPPKLAGELYPQGIPFHPEEDLISLIAEYQVDQVVFAYSDVPHEYVMHKASQVLAAGADFRLMGLNNTQIQSTKPVVLCVCCTYWIGEKPDHTASFAYLA